MSNAATDGGIYCDGRTYAEHCAWLNSLNADQNLIVHSPVGHRYTLVIISELKRMLMAETLPTGARHRFLEFLNDHSDVWPPEIIASIEPMCDAGAEIVREARKLGASKALDKYAEFDVFNAFCALNPSLLEALRMRDNIHWRPGDGRDQANRSN
jgi:hypothetical protein